MDTNPFAMSPNTPQQPQQTPSYLRQDPAASGHWMGGVSNMVKALMDGYANRPRPGPNAGRPVGPPLSLAPPPSPVGLPSSMPHPPPWAGRPVSPPSASNPLPPSVFTGGAAPIASVGMPTGAAPALSGMPIAGMPNTGLPTGAAPAISGQPIVGMPNGINQTLAGLFSKIPGEGSQFGG